jgi:thiol-disulfide isomerase/thioredoxin
MVDRERSRETPAGRLFLWVIGVNVLFVLASALYALWSWRALVDARRTVTELAALAGTTCEPDAAVAVPRPQQPPEDIAQSGYIGVHGVSLTRTLRLEIDGLTAADGVFRRRLGDARVLRPGGIHVVNLWAPWCEPCKQELPALGRLMDRLAARHGGAVEFVPVKVGEHGNPRDVYMAHAGLIPPARVRLADRDQGDPLLTSLGEHKLYKGELPVTFVLDCNRRVRWAQFKGLGRAELADLEQTLERLVQERNQTGQDAPCKRVWCGNGRCEGAEAIPGAAFCAADCARQPSLLPVVKKNGGCPAGCASCDGNGVCRQSSMTSPPPAPVRECKRRYCERRGKPGSCCSDCDCSEGLSCAKNGPDGYACTASLLAPP